MSSPRDERPQPRRDVFTQFPAAGADNLIVRYPFAGDGRLAYSFATTADRLVSTFTGSPSDDAMLLPYLYLYRHAMELELKQAIRYAARLRRAKGDSEPGLAPDTVNGHLKDRMGHRLMALVEALDLHLQALDLERTPRNVRQTLQLISNADKMGVAFRYSGALPNTQDNINFRALASSVQGAYRLLAATQDVLSAFEDDLRDFQEYKNEVHRDYEDEMRREFEDEMRREYEDEMRREYEGYY
jgi:hypothetical protein